MADGITIGASRNREELFARLQAGLADPWGRRIEVQKAQEGTGVYSFLRVAWDRLDPADQEGLCRCIAGGIADWVVDVWEKRLFREYIEREYSFFNGEEQAAILAKAVQLIDQREAGTKDYVVYSLNRRERIKGKILEYLQDESLLLIDGFLSFRLREYKRQVVDAADSAVDEFIMEREYNKFVRLLKYLVDGQEPKVREVHLFLGAGDKLELRDEAGNPVSVEQNRGEWGDLSEDDASAEDVIISALISLAPRDIWFHLREGFGETVQTAKHVFGERVHFCGGCDQCRRTSQGES